MTGPITNMLNAVQLFLSPLLRSGRIQSHLIVMLSLLSVVSAEGGMPLSPGIEAFLFNPATNHWEMKFPYARRPKVFHFDPVLFFEGKDVAEGEHTLAYVVQDGERPLAEGRMAIHVVDGQFRSETKLPQPLPRADRVVWKLDPDGQKPEQRTAALRYSRFSGRVRFHDPQIHLPAFINLVSTFWGQPGANLFIPVNEDGAFDAMVPARIYMVLNVQSSGYGCSGMERWTWDYDLTRPRQEEFVIGRMELYAMRAFNIPAGHVRTVFVLFRPTSLTRVFCFVAASS